MQDQTWAPSEFPYSEVDKGGPAHDQCLQGLFVHPDNNDNDHTNQEYKGSHPDQFSDPLA